MSASEVTPALSAGNAKLSLPSETGTVYFPVVSRSGASLAAVTCKDNDKPRGPKAFVVNGALGREVEAVLGDARYAEPGERNDICVDVRFATTGFADRSYTLALAVADKVARFGRAARARNTPIFATGAILTDQHGAIGPVGAIAEKAAFLLDTVPAGGVVLVPAANFNEIPPKLKSDIAARTKDEGVEWRFLEHLKDAADLWSEHPPGVGGVTGGLGWHSRVAVPAAAALVTLSVGLVIWTLLPVEGERRALQGSSSTFLPNSLPGKLVGQAGRSCEHLVSVTADSNTNSPGLNSSPNATQLALCRRQLLNSDLRLSTVLNAAGDAELAPDDTAALESLADAYAALREFDFSREHSLSMMNAIALGETTVRRIAISDARIRKLSRLGLTDLKGASAETLQELQEALAALTFFDLSRLTTEQKVDLQLAREAERLLMESDLRLMTVSHLVERALSQEDQSKRHRALEAANQLSNLDQQRAPILIEQVKRLSARQD